MFVEHTSRAVVKMKRYLQLVDSSEQIMCAIIVNRYVKHFNKFYGNAQNTRVDIQVVLRYCVERAGETGNVR